MVRSIKLDEDFWDNPKVIAAGIDGGLIYQEVLALNHRQGRDGILAPAESRPGYVARRLTGNFGWDADRVAAAWKACLDARLMVMSADGRLAIVGWDESWRSPQSGEDRTRAWRQRRSAQNGSVTPVTESTSQCDEANVTGVTAVASRCDEPPVTPVTPPVTGGGRGGSVPTTHSIPSEYSTPSVPSARTGTHARESQDGDASQERDGMGGRDGMAGRKRATVDAIALNRALAAAGVFERSADKRRNIVRTLVRRGVTNLMFESLVTRARKEGDKPAALLAHWLTDDNPDTLRVALREAGFGLPETKP